MIRAYAPALTSARWVPTCATSAGSHTPKSVFMCDGNDNTMNLKLNNDVKSSCKAVKSDESLVKEERRRTGRYIAILVGISLFLLALYHAWVRRIPVVASLVVPALIMFVYVAWVLYTASRDKHKFHLLDLEAAMNAPTPEPTENEMNISELTQNNIEVSAISSKETSNLNSPEGSLNKWTEVSTVLLKGEKNVRIEAENNNLQMPIILVNDKPPEDLDQKWSHIVESVSNGDKFKGLHTRRRYKRKFCRSRRHAVFKRSYSIA